MSFSFSLMGVINLHSIINATKVILFNTLSSILKRNYKLVKQYSKSIMSFSFAYIDISYIPIVNNVGILYRLPDTGSSNIVKST